jgi:hypothetical protein
MLKLTPSRMALLCVTLVAPCAWAQPAATGTASKLQSGKIVILTVLDGKERGGDVGAGSGANFTAAIRDALVSHGLSPFTSEKSSLVEGILDARQLGYDYVLRAVITQWEDNATAWSGKKDSAALSVEIYDLTPTLVASATALKKGSSWAMSSKSPDRLVPELTQTCLAKALGWPMPKK